MVFLVNQANQVMPLPGPSNAAADDAGSGVGALSPEDECSRLAFVLARYSRQEYSISFELLVGLLLCSRGALDLLQLNPFISEVHSTGEHKRSVWMIDWCLVGVTARGGPARVALVVLSLDSRVSVKSK